MASISLTKAFSNAVEMRAKALQLQPLSQSGNGWFPWGTIQESYTGAFQSNVEIRLDTVITNPTLFACITSIASDISKLCLDLVQKDDDGVWSPIESSAFSPVLREPNHFQTIEKFVENWMVSKLTQGNTYVLLKRDQRRVVQSMYVLDPSRVTPLVAPDESVYYELRRDDLSGLPRETVTVPASEIIHDRMVSIFHPLIGVTPIFACGAAAAQGNSIQANSSKFFSNGSRPGGILIAPKGITQPQAESIKTAWQAGYSGDNYGKIAVIGGELSYQDVAQTAVDSQLIEQLKWSDERICSAYKVPPYIVGVGPHPPYANAEPLLQAYYTHCLQKHIKDFESVLDKGLGLKERIDGKQYGVAFDIDDLIWMDQAARGQASKDSVGTLSTNEARYRYYNAKPVDGGDSPMVQQQYYSLAALAERDKGQPFAPAPAASSVPATDLTHGEEVDDDVMDMAASFGARLHQKAMDAGLYAA